MLCGRTRCDHLKSGSILVAASPKNQRKEQQFKTNIAGHATTTTTTIRRMIPKITNIRHVCTPKHKKVKKCQIFFSKEKRKKVKGYARCHTFLQLKINRLTQISCMKPTLLLSIRIYQNNSTRYFI